LPIFGKSVIQELQALGGNVWNSLRANGCALPDHTKLSLNMKIMTTLEQLICPIVELTITGLIFMSLKLLDNSCCLPNSISWS